VERSFGLAFTTLTIPAPPAHAAHPKQAVQPEGTADPFEVNGSTSRPRQNSVALLTERCGSAHAADGADDSSDLPSAGSGMTGGCTAAGGLPGGAMALARFGLLRRRRPR